MTTWTFNRISTTNQIPENLIGGIEITNDDMLTLSDPNRRREAKYNLKSLFEDGTDYEFCCHKDGALFVSTESSDHVWVIDVHFALTSNNDVREHRLKRLSTDPTGLAFSRFFEVDSLTVFVYESGLICFENNGEVRWRTDHVRLDHYFDNLIGGKVIYVDSEGTKVFQYDVVTGLCEFQD